MAHLIWRFWNDFRWIGIRLVPRYPKYAYTNLEKMEKDFIEPLSLMGIKHNTVTQNYNFKQAKHETIIDYLKILKK